MRNKEAESPASVRKSNGTMEFEIGQVWNPGKTGPYLGVVDANLDEAGGV